VTFLEGTDNIYRDLGFPEAAKLLGVSQPRLSDLYKGELEKFTIDILVKWLAKLGKQVTISVADQDVVQKPRKATQ
jgi:predicted XRE-type DNA-binding protein